MPKQLNFLGVTKMVGTAGALDPADAVYEDLVNIPIFSGISAGIRLKTLIFGLVPVYEEHAARKSEGYKLKEWYELSSFERAFAVAVFRTEKAIESHQNDAEIAEMKKKNK